ncbi:MAG: hypothetical protein KKA61_02875 [Nanoarchaeota archaeon]|nr:hypothetical protein [Nanoarchaeota archaeon]MBU4283950.1 hypothetical protein [Nanoarchaeota archaeon]MBU4493290.1 hypothetical protein [Nanoarchaeota archaeon]
MSGPAKSKIEIKNVKVYIHKKDPLTNSRIMHIDIESPELNEIIKDGEATYCAGKQGGVFIGLKKEMIKKAEKFVMKKDKK